MTYVRALHRYAIIELTDSDHSEHGEIAGDISCLLDRNFKIFVIDFKHVKKFNSHILSLLAGIHRVIAGSEGKLFVSKILPTAGDMVKLCGLDLVNLQADDMGQLVGMDEDCLREVFKVISNK